MIVVGTQQPRQDDVGVALAVPVCFGAVGAEADVAERLHLTALRPKETAHAADLAGLRGRAARPRDEPRRRPLVGCACLDDELAVDFPHVIEAIVGIDLEQLGVELEDERTPTRADLVGDRVVLALGCEEVPLFKPCPPLGEQPQAPQVVVLGFHTSTVASAKTVMERVRGVRSSVSSYTFESFVDDVEWRVRALAWSVAEPDFQWPGLLILDVAAGLDAEAFAIGKTPEERDQLVRELVANIRGSRARRFAWVMPCLRRDGKRTVECLLVVCGERGRVEALLAQVVRLPGKAPRLSRFSRGAFGSGARRVSGRFVEPLQAALERLVEDVPEARFWP